MYRSCCSRVIVGKWQLSSFLLAGLLACPAVHAGAVDLPWKSPRDTALGFSLGPNLTDEAEASFLNPAGLASLRRGQTSIGMTLIHMRTGFEGSAYKAGDTTRPLSGSRGGNPGGFYPPLPDLAVAAPLGDKLTLGMSIHADGLQFQYADDWVGRYHGISTDIQIPTLSVALGMHFHSRFRAGVGLRLQRLEYAMLDHVDLGEIIEAELAASCATTSLLPERMPLSVLDAPVLSTASCRLLVPENRLGQRYDFSNRMTGRGIGLGWHIGFQWSPTRGSWLGLSFHSTITHNLSGKVSRTRFGPGWDGTPGWNATELRNDPNLAVLRQYMNIRAVLSDDPDFDSAVIQPSLENSMDGHTGGQVQFPYRLSVGWQQHGTDHLMLMLSATWSPWGELNELRAEFNDQRPDLVRSLSLADTLMLAAGLEWRHPAHWQIRAGLAYESGTTDPQKRLARAPDGQRVHLGLGTGWQITNRWVADTAITYTHIRADRLDETEPLSGHRVSGPLQPPRIWAASVRVRWLWGH